MNKMMDQMWSGLRGRVVQELESGRTAKQIAEGLGCNPSTLSVKLQSWGIEARKYPRCHKIDPSEADKIRQLRASGVTVSEIAKKRYKVSWSTVQSFCIRHGIDTSPSRRRQRTCSDAEVSEMIHLHAEKRWSQRRIGNKFGIGQAQVSRLLVEAGYHCLNREVDAVIRTNYPESWEFLEAY